MYRYYILLTLVFLSYTSAISQTTTPEVLYDYKFDNSYSKVTFPDLTKYNAGYVYNNNFLIYKGAILYNENFRFKVNLNLTFPEKYDSIAITPVPGILTRELYNNYFYSYSYTYNNASDNSKSYSFDAKVEIFPGLFTLGGSLLKVCEDCNSFSYNDTIPYILTIKDLALYFPSVTVNKIDRPGPPYYYSTITGVPYMYNYNNYWKAAPYTYDNRRSTFCSICANYVSLPSGGTISQTSVLNDCMQKASGNITIPDYNILINVPLVGLQVYGYKSGTVTSLTTVDIESPEIVSAFDLTGREIELKDSYNKPVILVYKNGLRKLSYQSK